MQHQLIAEKVCPEDIPPGLLKDAGKEKFSLYPFLYDGHAFHQHRWQNMDRKEILFWGVRQKDTILAVIEFHSSDYDSNLLALKAGTIQNVFTDPQMDDQKREEVLQELIRSFQLYRQAEKIGFCFVAVNNWDAALSLSFQRNRFNYILTWGKCFTQQPASLPLPEGYIVRKSESKEDIPFILGMSDSYFKGGRFYLDERIGASKADQVYKDLINNSSAKGTDLAVLYNKEEVPLACFICPLIQYQFEQLLSCYSLRLLVVDNKKAPKGIASAFMAATAELLLKDVPLVESGIEMHNLPSLKIHINAGFRMNYVFSAYHSWI
ncbi:MAG TPA: hypothetical protein VMZ03_09030 [Chitinophagaceae bacterium]|nr:hypothetical protein [Chitinophagaceae bacterium]